MSSSTPPPYGSPSPYGSPAPYAGPPPSRAAAGWALGLAIVPICGIGAIVSIALAVSVLGRGGDGRDHGRTMAIVALVLDGLWLVGIVTYLALGLATGSDDTSTGSSSSVTLSDIAEGDCFDSDVMSGAAPGAGTFEVGEVSPVRCGRPHQFQLYAREQIPGGAYPGVEQAAAQTEALCRDAFGHFVGVSFERSELDVVFVHPLPRGWAGGDHYARCVIGEVDRSRITGSLRLARR